MDTILVMDYMYWQGSTVESPFIKIMHADKNFLFAMKLEFENQKRENRIDEYMPLVSKDGSNTTTGSVILINRSRVSEGHYYDLDGICYKAWNRYPYSAYNPRNWWLR
jgi:hypothetical protein